MDLDLNLNHPLADYDPMTLMKNGASLPPEALDAVIHWADAIYKGFGEGETLLAPREGKTVMRGMTASLAALARDSFEFIREDYEDFEAKEYEAPAALFLAIDLVTRQRGTLVARAATAKEIAERRGWNVVEDVTASLLEMEGRLVRHGEVVLRRHPDLAAEFTADNDDRSYDDTQNDIRRRLDFIASEKFAPLFEASRRTAKLVEEAETLTREANVFRQSRETAREASVLVTLRRNVLYTAWNTELTTLQKTLRGALENDHPDLLGRVEAKFWRSLSSLSRKARRPKPEDLAVTDEEPEATESAEEPVEEEGGS